MVKDINKISNPTKVAANFKRYKGNDDATLSLSSRSDKKYKVTVGGKTIHFGSTQEDFTKHQDVARQKSYLARANGIKGEWRKDKYSKNNLAINLLWS
jgi:uncharacterized membrane protein YvbJ